ncbi:MAG: ftsZ [Bacteroidetes bacterium]|nr:ftsZ [Bacteroidota bacterium]
MPEFEVLQFEAPKENSNYIKVIGVGGGGTNAVNHMFNQGIEGVDFIVCNTDSKSLNASPVKNKIKIGKDGLGAGNRPEVGRAAALAAEEGIKTFLSNRTQMLFITAGMGGGTGTGAAPVIAKFAKEIEFIDDNGEKIEDEILVVAIVTLPLSFEGKRRKEQAQEGIRNLKEVVDAIIIVNTDKIRDRGNVTLPQMFPIADDVLLTASKGIAEIITLDNSHINVDFRDVQEVMQKSGVALMGVGTAYGSGEERALEAIAKAASSDLLNDCDIKGTKNILLYITSSPEDEYAITLDEQAVIAEYINEKTGCEPDIIWGVRFDKSYKDRIDLTLIATGFEEREIYNPHTMDSINRVKVLTPEKPAPVKPAEIAQENKIETNTIVTTPIAKVVEEPHFVKAIEPIVEVAKVEVEANAPLKHYLDVEIPTSQINEVFSRPSVVEQPSRQNQPTQTIQQPQAIQTEPRQSTTITFIDEPIEKPLSVQPEVEIKPLQREQTTKNPFFDENKNQEKIVADRQKRMELFSQLMRDKDGLERIINTPAYEQYGMDIEGKPASSSAIESSRINLNGGNITMNNTYLHDNPD